MNKPNYCLDIPADVYHAATKANEYTTSHRLALFRKCPALYHKHITGEIVDGDTAAFVIGRAVHVLTLEGRAAFDREYLVTDGPINAKTGKPYGKDSKAYRDWAALQPLPAIGLEDCAEMEKISAAVHTHAHAAELLSDGFAECTVRTTWNGEPIQARLDWFDPSRGIIADLKTCRDVDRFPYDIRDFGYVHQLAFYKRALELAGYKGKPLAAYLIAVEKQEPYRVAVAELCALTLEDGNRALAGKSKWGTGNEPLLAELAACRANGVWPTRYEDIIHI